jgi:hypothetical protein
MKTIKIEPVYLPAYQNLLVPPIGESSDIPEFVQSLFYGAYKDNGISKGVRRKNVISFKKLDNVPFMQSLKKYGVETDELKIEIKDYSLGDRFARQIEHSIMSLTYSKEKFLIFVDMRTSGWELHSLKRLYKTDGIMVLVINSELLKKLFESYKKGDLKEFDDILQAHISYLR